MNRLVDIILPLAISDVYTYNIPVVMQYPPVGVRVLVPLGRKSVTGIVYRQHEGELPATIKVRDVIDVLDEQPVVTAEQLRLWEWLAQYYMCTLGEVLSAALPSGIIDDDYKALTTQYIHLHPSHEDPRQQELTLASLHRAKSQEQLLRCFLRLNNNGVERRTLLEASGVGSAVLRTMIDKGIFLEQERAVSRLRLYTGVTRQPHALDLQQQQAVSAIQQQWQNKQVMLLHGVTSSGKTEVYIHLIEQMLQQGKQVLYLVPEIALTTQLTDRLQAIFGNQLVVYHSRFSNAERVEIYQDVQQSCEPKLILGARSAIFLPFTNLGLIIVDEEHEPSYKQQDPAPRYHARSAAIMMARWYGAKVLLGTATPSVESYYNAAIGKYGLVEMMERFRGLQLPKITLVDLQRQYHRKEMYGHFADPVVFRMREEIARGKQVILFQNRRGYAPFLQCPSCGEVPKCPNCDVSMTFHKSSNTLVCHSCGYTQSSIAHRQYPIAHSQSPIASLPSPISHCPKCGSAWKLRGIGTERLEEEIQSLFPNARVARMDLDTTRRKDAHQQIIDRFAQHEVDILIGTQMVTKGLHFDDVSLVVVLQADSLVNQPDFRSAEHAFQMLEQVSGRAGRTGQAGEVMIQTFDVNNPLFALLVAHNYRGLYEQQVSEREMFCFPPFHRLIVLSLRHRDVHRLEHSSGVLMQELQGVFGNRVSSVITPLVSRRNNMHIRQLRLRVEAGANIVRAKQMLREHIDTVLRQTDCKGTTVTIDVDP